MEGGKKERGKGTGGKRRGGNAKVSKAVRKEGRKKGRQE